MIRELLEARDAKPSVSAFSSSRGSNRTHLASLSRTRSPSR
jgi:hypothetical protein